MNGYSSMEAWTSKGNPGDPPSIQDPSFSAMLKEIFEQTQSEIQASTSRSQMARHGRSRSFGYQFAVPDETQRFEPLVDPALSYISNILAEEDESGTGDPCMSLSEYLVYKAKAQEFAALLTEDSPSLRVKVDPDNALSPDDGSNSTSEDSNLHAAHDLMGAEIFGSLDMQTPSLSDLFSVSPLTEIYQNGCPPEMFRCLPFPKPASVFSVDESYVNDPQLLQAFGHAKTPAQEGGNPIVAGQATEKIATEEKSRSLDEQGLKPNAHRGKASKTDKNLKPRKEAAGGAKKRSGGKARASKDGEQDLVDINDLLVQSAQAVGVNNIKRAVEYLKKAKQYASPYGNKAQRLAYYFAEALDARFSNTGWPLYLGLMRRCPSPAEVLKASYVFMASCPFVKASHYFINQTILDAAKGASRLHIMELQITGFPYPSLFKALAERHGGPPFVRITGVGFPHYSMMPAKTEMILEGVQKTGRQLAGYAASCGVPFEYTAWAGTREELEMHDFVNEDREKDDVFIVISAYMLRYVMDETLDSPSARLRLLRMGRSLNPNVYIQGIVTGAYSTPFFTRRFKEALFHFESLFDMLDAFIDRENTDRIIFESEILGKAILNIVACEGAEVVERIDKYKHWQAISEEVGFQQLPLNEDIKRNAQAMLQTWHKEYTVTEDSQYMVLGWKGRMLHAMSTWKASAVAAPA